MAEGEPVRLHITPLNPDLLDRYLTPSLKAHAANISFHSVETFPERGFGYLELPAMEAQKLKKKLNGTTLKGSKVKIEEAKPDKKRKGVEARDEEDAPRKKAKKEKRKKEDGVLLGHELEEGRHVKRGWVDDAKVKKTKKDKKSEQNLEGKKMRFKTEVPPNKVTVDEKEAKQKRKSKTEEQKGKAGKKPVVVKEFAKTSKPSTTETLGRKSERRAVGYEEGKGWVDADGDVVEGEPPSKRKKKIRARTITPDARPERAPVPAAEPESVSDAESTSDSEVSSVVSSDSSSSSEPEASEHEETVDRQLNEAKSNTASNAQAERDRANSVAIPSAERDATPPKQKEVHPLEALFKRSTAPPEEAAQPKKPAPIDTSFSFFSGDAQPEDDEVATEHIPQTPRTKEELEWRSIRSAAPTPDTAAIGKRFDFTFASHESNDADQEDDEEVDAELEQARAGAERDAPGNKEESEFRKWFYENRGDLNRAWKKRRREERKVVRQRENRRLSRRVA